MLEGVSRRRRRRRKRRKRRKLSVMSQDPLQRQSRKLCSPNLIRYTLSILGGVRALH